MIQLRIQLMSISLINTIVTLQFDKVHWMFANWRKYTGYIGESSLVIRQLAKVQVVYWRKFTGSSPIGESTGGVLAKVYWSFANGESPFCESPIGEVPVTQKKSLHQNP